MLRCCTQASISPRCQPVAALPSRKGLRRSGLRIPDSNQNTLCRCAPPRAAAAAITVQPVLVDLRQDEQPQTIVAPAATKIMNLTPAELQQLIQGDTLTLVDYYTDWCGPCKLMEKELDKLSQAFKTIQFVKMDCGEHVEFATQSRIRSLPTFRLYLKGRMVDQITGARPVQLRQLLSHYYRPF